jgi:predicted HTH transcriptional regulator
MAVDLTLDEQGALTRAEGKTLEYKRDLSSPDQVLTSIVAFANSAGGDLVVGVADDRSVVGLADPLLEEERLSNLISDSIRPQLMPTVDLVPAGGQTLLVARVALGSQPPYYLKKLGRYEGTYIRVGSSDRKAGPSLVDELDRVGKGRSYDRLPNPDAALTDLDPELLASMLGRGVDEPAMRTLGLARVEQNLVVPTNGGVLVGTHHPETFMPHAWVQCARFRGPRKRDITDQANIYGPLPLAVEKVMDFFRRNAFLRAEFSDSPRRTDVWSIPLEPLRELVVNALVHSSYAEHGSPIKVAFLDDEIRIESPGGLVPGMTVEQMIQGTSAVRNPVVARVFREMGLIEQWGTGIPEVFAALAERGLPAPVIEEGHERLRITIHIQSHDPLVEAAGSEQHVTDAGVDVSMSGVYVSKYAEVLLRAAADGPVARSDLLAAAGLSQSPTNFRRHVLPLVSAGLLEFSIPDKPRSPKQRYLITAAGRALLGRGDGT